MYSHFKKTQSLENTYFSHSVMFERILVLICSTTNAMIKMAMIVDSMANMQMVPPLNPQVSSAIPPKVDPK